jgi:hypothetical protein
MRRIAERTRPRDLYDVVNLYRNADARPEHLQFVEVLRQKCAFKGIQLPQLVDIEGHRSDVEAGWMGMLNHQLPALLPLASILCTAFSPPRRMPSLSRSIPKPCRCYSQLTKSAMCGCARRGMKRRRCSSHGRMTRYGLSRAAPIRKTRLRPDISPWPCGRRF